MSEKPSDQPGDPAFEAHRCRLPWFGLDPWKDPLSASRLGHALALIEIQRLKAKVEELEARLETLTENPA
jgi:hypothetical protein